MKARHILFILILFLLAGTSCKKINPINTDSNLKLEFSADTVLFDTVFTSLGSATHELRIYNRNSDDLQISSIRLAQGDGSPFRLNLDGESATEIYDKIIPAKDSLFSFLRVTINPNDLNTPFVVEDELEFVTNGNTQTVKLLAWGQNANYIVGDKVTNVIQGKYTIVADSLQTTIWTKERPYVIYGWALINSYGTLRIEAGTKVYCHQGSGIFSWSDGQLVIEGTAEEPVVIQGDRLESYYSDTPGQWEQIMLMDGRPGADHSISHAIIRNGFIGINCQSVLKWNLEYAVHIDNTIIENQSGYGIYSIYYPVDAQNCVIANCGYGNLWALGGTYHFIHSTISNYWNANEHNNNEHAISAMNYATDASTDEIVYLPFHMEMDNCIIYGKQKDELKTIFGPDADSSYVFDHCLIRSEKYNSDMPGFQQCLFNLDPLFADPLKPDCHIDSLASPVIGMGNPLIGNQVPYDLDGVSRVGAPDLGAYQYVGQ